VGLAPTGKRRLFTAHADGSHFTVSFDGTQMFTADDTTFPEGGKIALWTAPPGTATAMLLLIAVLALVLGFQGSRQPP